MKTRTLKILMLLAVLAGNLVSCKKEDTTKTATGTIIGGYFNGSISVLVQVDKKYPIGGTIKHSKDYYCVNLPHDGSYQNMIQVQPFSALSDTATRLLNKKILFSYREYRQEEDVHLFSTDKPWHGLCGPPNVPMYVITNYQPINE